MVNTIVSIPGYVHLYRSLLRFYDMPENEIREMLYLLNTANLDCYEYYHPERELALSGPVAFCHWLETMDCRPYRTEVQLYKSLLFLQHSVDRDLIVTSQREALQTLKCIISNIEYRFYKAYEMEIEDKRTVYGECTYRAGPQGGRAERVPDARLDLSAKRVNCHGFYTGFGTKPFSKEGCLITQKEVNAVFDGQVALCREILQKKTKEYTGGDTDRLGAFKAAAALQHTTPERALAGMLAKHIVSLYDMCFADGMSFDAGTWDEKITDSLNYLFLLKAIVKEGQTNQQN